MYLAKYLSTSGVASRRRAADLVKSGAVRVNGAVERNPARFVEAGDRVECDGVRVPPPNMEKIYLVLHKPRGYVCTHSDPHAAHRAVELIDLPGRRLIAAGRLDKESEGMLVFSDDGDFIFRLSHPSCGALKRYEVETDRELSSAALEKIRSGIEDDGEFLRPESVRKIAPRHYEFILREGKKREIRRLTASCGARTLRLCRRAIGQVELGDLPAGSWRELSPAEQTALFQTPDQRSGK